jgi:hypothetical protein
MFSPQFVARGFAANFVEQLSNAVKALRDAILIELADAALRRPHAGSFLVPCANSVFYGIAAAANGLVPATAAHWRRSCVDPTGVRKDGRKIIDVRAVQAEVSRRLSGQPEENGACHPESFRSAQDKLREGSACGGSLGADPSLLRSSG